MSHTVLTYHLIFGTYLRYCVIPIDHEKELYKFIFDFATARGIKVRRIGGMPDHVHILCDIPAKIAVAEFVQLIKTESCKFLHVNPHFPAWYKWAEGYGAFTVDPSLRDARVRYIMDQKLHHGTRSFAEEYRTLLIDAGYDISTPLLGDE